MPLPLSGEWMPRVVIQDGLVGLQRLRGLVEFLVRRALSKQQQGEELEVTGIASLQRNGTRLLGEIEGMVWPPNPKLDDGEGVDQVESLRYSVRASRSAPRPSSRSSPRMASRAFLTTIGSLTCVLLLAAAV